ncbi:Tetrathionate response regulatory protein TtrR [Ferriphaselus amnicola]|uniref:Tetrathionate response regulatory protein TtrR n=1 Tax=Ferriphaselus amnicola TaxID=1188319 RepID=A0A2Z6G8A9_9PROT|nr:Tetrathionate response regulatory protein TtrR [Ferriphaselus amnicola]
MQQSLERTAIVVDADSATYKALSRFAWRQQFSVETFNNHSEFIEWMASQSANPTIIKRACCLVIEVQVLRLINENSFPNAVRDIPKIYIGVPNFSCELSKLARMGFYSFIEKPCTVGQLGAGVMSAFDYHEKLLSGAAHITERITCLSKREREVGSLVVRGLTNQEIAAELGISIKTVKAHRARVMEKTNSDSLVDLVRCFDSFSQLSIRGE